MKLIFGFPGKLLPFGKKTIYPLLPLLLIFISSSHAQGLKVGSTVPDLVIPRIINFDHSTAKLSDFKGKLLILDFWATWCSPCVAMIPKMETLQKQFTGKIQILPVSYQEESVVAAYLQKFHSGKVSVLPDVVGDKQLGALFPHTYLPHYVWIGSTGTVVAITGDEALTTENIERQLGGNAITAKTKNDDVPVFYSNDKPFLLAGNGGNGQSMIFHSVLTGYVAGLGLGFSYRADSVEGWRVSMRNLPLKQMFTMAYSDKDNFAKNRVILNVKDTSKLSSGLRGQELLDWMKLNNAFCYEIIVPNSMSGQLYDIMREDISRYFNQYKMSVEKRKTRCILLQKTSTAEKFRSKGGKSSSEFTKEGFTMQNFPLNRLVGQLNFVYLRGSPYTVIDDTGYTGWVDMDVTADLGDIDSINLGLASYGLKLVEADKDVDVLVISDRK